jgi:hypothetical protein
MRHLRKCVTCFVFCWAVIALLALNVRAGEYPNPEAYLPTFTQFMSAKADFDDPRPTLKTLGPKQVLPKEFYAELSYDIEKMKNLWAELIGFRAPEVVGKIRPEIKPGKYTYKDVQNNPAFKELMAPVLYERIKPGGPPFAGNIPEFEIIPTRQYYWALPVAEATKRNLGKVKLDNQGYLIGKGWESGYPFPKPSGPFKAQQIFYNYEKRYLNWEDNFRHMNRGFGWNKNLNMDLKTLSYAVRTRLAGRVLMKPYGWFDERAKEMGEFKSYINFMAAPRDIAGVAQSLLQYLDPDKPNLAMIYVPSLRRMRKMSSTDTQDPAMGLDLIWDDGEGFTQKISRTRYPYKIELIGEREYLVPALSEDGAEYQTSQEKGVEFRNIKMERRPVHVLKMTQLDPNYVYSYRILYLDQETFNIIHLANYDQKGRLYRTTDIIHGWFPEMGMISWWGDLELYRDFVDMHSTTMFCMNVPADYSRADVSMAGVVQSAK